MERRTYRVSLAYDGAPFRGFSRQPGLPTVELSLRDALTPILGKPPRLAVAGRTDRGVHALGQVISFCCFEDLDLARVAAAIDTAENEALFALEVRKVGRSFHAQYSARARHYVYLYEDDPESLDARRIDQLLCALQGRRCLTAFARDTPPGKSTVRTLRSARARRTRHRGRSVVRFDFSADSFLRHQVRIMVSTAVREAPHACPTDILCQIAESQDRRATAPPAPPERLYLARVTY